MMATAASTVAAIQAASAEAQAIGVIVVPGTIVKLGLSFGAVGLLPWACGQMFARGHVPAGSQVVADCAEFQCIPVSYFDDGSVRWARVAGKCQVGSPGRVDVAMRLGPVATASPPFVRTAPPDVQITINGTRIAPTVTKVIAQDSVMMHEQWTCKLDAQVSVVYETQAFNDGRVRLPLPPSVENMGFMAGGQTARSLVLKVVIGGATTFAETVLVRHHSSAFLMRGATWEYWIGGDPKVAPAHDGAYLCKTESFPPYAVGPATIGNVAQSYAPNYIGESGPGMADTGFSPHIGLLPLHGVLPLTTGGAKAWSYMMAESLSSGSWSTHLRDETTGAPPLPSKYPLHSWQSNVPNGSGGTNSVGTVDTSHQPSFTYTAALLTGTQWFIDEHLRWTIYNHFWQHETAAYRQGAKGIIRSDSGLNQDRGAAWGLRTLAQCIALLPANSPHLPDLIFAWQSNMAFYATLVSKPPYQNALGVIAPYTSSGESLYQGADRGNSTAWWGSAWMQHFITMTLGYALQMHLPVGAQAQADNAAVFQFSAKLAIGLTGPTNWRRCGRYAMPWWPDGMQRPPGAWYPDFGVEIVEYEKAKGLTAQSTAPGGILFKHSTNSPIDGTDWQQGYIAKVYAALVYAVMHKAPGADAALARVMASSSWPLIAAARQVPIWAGMMPPGYVHPGA